MSLYTLFIAGLLVIALGWIIESLLSILGFTETIQMKGGLATKIWELMSHVFQLFGWSVFLYFMIFQAELVNKIWQLIIGAF